MAMCVTIISHFGTYFNHFLKKVKFLRNRYFIVLFFAALVVSLSVFRALPSDSEREYSREELSGRENYRMNSRGADKADLNSAPKAVLAGIPYIGKYAEEICALREELGGFSSLEELALIPGIGAETVMKSAEFVRIVN